MGDGIIDTNVLLIASAIDPNSPFGDSDVPADEQSKVLNWLMDFRLDNQRRIVLDQYFKIWEEYNNKMNGQDLGLLIMSEKLQSSLLRTVDIKFDEHGFGRLPNRLARVVTDRADRKIVAVALADRAHGGECSIVNASDTDWYDWEESLAEAGVMVTQIIDGWCRGKWRDKKRR